MKGLITGFICMICLVTTGQQLHIDPGAIFYIEEGVKLEVGGDLENNGILLNNGTLALFEDWKINNIFNGNEGTLEFVGFQDQEVENIDIRIRNVVMNQSGEVRFLNDEFTVTNRLQLTNGVVKVDTTSEFILASEARVVGGSPVSYVNGLLTYRGSGIRQFPLGSGGIYAPISFLNVFGSDPELKVQFIRPNPEAPKPDEALLGVSSFGLWETNLTNGSMNPTPIEIAFSGEDLENFEIPNNIQHKFKSPVIAISDSAGGTFTSLGVSELMNTDSVSFGVITSEIDFALNDSLQTAYLAIALAPRIDPDGLVYIPEIFSPAATDPDNQTFRVFGERISEDGFSMQVYNRFGGLVYSTNSFQEANQIGWSGINQRTNKEEPSGIYYYQVVLMRENGLVEQFQGPFYLQR